MLEWVLIFSLLILLIIIILRYLKLKDEISKIRGEIDQRSKELFDKWRKEEMEREREIIEKSMKVELEKWKREEEGRIREEAIKQSMSTTLGKVGEQLAPLLFFHGYNINLKDVRFIGSPIDFIAFKGLSDEKPEVIYFIEVKAGKSASLNDKESMVKKLVEEKKVEWITFHITKELPKLQGESKEETKELSEGI